MISLKKADYEKILAHAKSCVPEEAFFFVCLLLLCPAMGIYGSVSFS